MQLTLISSQIYFNINFYLLFCDKILQNTQKYLQEFSCISTYMALLIFDSTLRQREHTDISVRANGLAAQQAWVLTGTKVLDGKYMQVRHAHGDSSPQYLTPTEQLIL